VLYGPRSIFDSVKATDLKVQQAKSDTGQETPQLELPQALQGNVEVRRIKVY
jgi:hypothetical protein